MTESNLAYKNIDGYNGSAAPVLEKEPVRKIKVKFNPRRRGSAIKIMVLSVAVCALLCFMVAGKLRETKLYNELSTTTAELELINSQNVKMQTEIESITSKNNVEDYAENVLGLEKINRNQIEFIDVQNDEVLATKPEEKNLFIKIKNLFDDFAEYIMG